MSDTAPAELELFTTFSYSKADQRDYLTQIRQIAQWSEQAGFHGTLIYTDNSTVDPWLVGQEVLRSTERLAPLIALQPAYLHPYAAAKMIATYGCLYGRRVCLNLVAGGFQNDLAALGDRTPHDERYQRLVEYALIIKGLLAGPEPVTFGGRYYAVKNLAMTPSLPPAIQPGILISGSSPAGLAAAGAIGATPIRYPEPLNDNSPVDVAIGGVRIGIIARETSAEAWRVALDRFPPDRRGRIMHTMAKKVSDSHWYARLSDLEERPAGPDSPYWLGPFRNYRSRCPYLVGSYQEVSAEVARYIQLGCHTFILDVPRNEEELQYTALVFEQAAAAVADIVRAD
ncbi:LLM class flavin-dependent oxidoreductase [Kitasatospora atroaurantiaca]|uniref:Alkanesulfonate monooxygenase n=1 Tax=Kitasatospora atroaurantiaca TaxID=285545 RepID=A0A561EKX0_9ACTN|nr:LLM class flavin-dependent oxidoreductase [Kitasatospora atroaurantiaca]TWE16209.1 alkanesulfonate monooxygenase [Kitasatospora atroaurantiaca]